MKTLIFTLLTITAVFSQAQNLHAEDVAKVYYSAKCDHRCQNGFSVDFYPSKDIVKLPFSLVRALEKLSWRQAQIWGDTILEGDYYADGKTQLDSVSIIRQGSRVIGYGITYSERAWYTGDCSFVPRDYQSLASCKEGRIIETSFVSANAVEVARDENQIADFKTKD